MNRVAIIGAAGLLGQYLVEGAKSLGYEVLGTYRETRITRTGVCSEHLDLTDSSEVKRVLSDFDPDLVFLPSALTNVDHCETRPDEARRVNVEGTRNVVSVCNSLGSNLLYISTDYVFDGEKNGHYSEADRPAPLSVYARTKLDGERIVLEQSRNTVCRVSVLYGWNYASSKSNFVTWVIDAMRKSKQVTLFGDQFVSPTYAPHCAGVIMNMAARGAVGLYHTSGPDCIDRYSIGLKVSEAFDLDPSLCKDIRTKDLPLPATRPKNSCLDVSKAEREFGIRMLPLSQGLEDMRSREKKQ